MRGGTAQSLDPLITRLAGWWRTSPRHVGFGVRIDVAESAAEADVDSSELTGVVLGSVIKNTPLRTCFDAGRDALPAGVGVVDPGGHTCSSIIPSARGERRGKCCASPFYRRACPVTSDSPGSPA